MRKTMKEWESSEERRVRDETWERERIYNDTWHVTCMNEPGYAATHVWRSRCQLGMFRNPFNGDPVKSLELEDKWICNGIGNPSNQKSVATTNYYWRLSFQRLVKTKWYNWHIDLFKWIDTCWKTIMWVEIDVFDIPWDSNFHWFLKSMCRSSGVSNLIPKRSRSLSKIFPDPISKGFLNIPRSNQMPRRGLSSMQTWKPKVRSWQKRHRGQLTFGLIISNSTVALRLGLILWMRLILTALRLTVTRIENVLGNKHMSDIVWSFTNNVCPFGPGGVVG